MKNQDIAEVFSNIATLLEIKGDNAFKIRAYRRAAENICNRADDIEQLSAENRLGEIEGLGPALTEKIREYITTGTVSAYEQLTRELPASLLDVVRIPSVGPKKAGLFYRALNVKSIDDLSTAIERKELIGLPGVQEKTIQNIARGIRLLKTGQERMDPAEASYVADSFVSPLSRQRAVRQVSVAGSVRRQRETVRDIDILVDSARPDDVIRSFAALPQVARVIAQGETKASVITNDNIQVDLRVVASGSYGAALLYFTGSKYFNITMRQLAIRKKMKINEYGLFKVAGNRQRRIAGKTEQEMFRALGLCYVPPELREDIGGAELFTLERTPPLVELSDIKGDLHIHSVWSDGHDSIEKIARAAEKRGYEYVAVCDHTPQLKVVKTVSPRDVVRKRAEIDRVNKKCKRIRILAGTEVEIDAEGNLDYNNTILREFDFVIAAIHSGFKQPASQLTKRLLGACRNKHVTAIAHPRGTHLGKREPYPVDFREVCRAAVDTNTFLEINAFPLRLDLNSADTFYARQQGVRFVVNTDSHSTEHLDFMRFGIAVARRGWCHSTDVVNTLPLEKLLKEIAR